MVTFLRNILVVVVFGLISNGCLIRPNCHTSDFSVFDKPNSNSLKLNGVYVSKNLRGSFFLYQNGLYKYRALYPISEEFWSDPQKGFQEILNSGHFISKENWGRFQIKDGKIEIQDFNRSPDEFCKRWLSEVKGYVVDDSTIVIETEISTWPERQVLFEGENIYKFYPTESKPDSTLAWFLNKRWYKKGMAETNEEL